MNRNLRLNASLLLCSLFFCSASSAQSLLREASVQADRFVDAPVVTKLPAGTPLKLLKSEAGWAQIKAGDVTGWVRASVVDGAGAKHAATAQMQGGRLAGNNILSTSGVRGPDQKVEPVSAAVKVETRTTEAKADAKTESKPASTK